MPRRAVTGARIICDEARTQGILEEGLRCAQSVSNRQRGQRPIINKDGAFAYRDGGWWTLAAPINGKPQYTRGKTLVEAQFKTEDLGSMWAEKLDDDASRTAEIILAIDGAVQKTAEAVKTAAQAAEAAREDARAAREDARAEQVRRCRIERGRPHDAGHRDSARRDQRPNLAARTCLRQEEEIQ
ncbi:hypothetical protein [Schaalia cardiffensis]